MLCDETRIPKQRERSGAISREVELQIRIRRQVFIYFYMVRRSACWALRVMRSTSLSTTTLYRTPLFFQPLLLSIVAPVLLIRFVFVEANALVFVLVSSGTVCAISRIICITITRS